MSLEIVLMCASVRTQSLITRIQEHLEIGMDRGIALPYYRYFFPYVI